MFPSDLEVPDELEYVVLKDLTLEDRNYYLFIRDLEERKARKAGVSTEGELMEKAREGGYWTKLEDDIETRGAERLAFLESEFKAKAKFRSRQNIIKVQIEDVLAKQKYVEDKRLKMKHMSAEYLAHEIACFQLLKRVVIRPDDSLLITDDDTFLRLKEEYVVFLYYLVQEVMQEGAFETATLREIARSTEWRLTWSLSRENLPALFGRGIGDLTINHRMLIYWSRVYDSVFEAPDPPDDETIKDDELFDDWLSDRDAERRGHKTNRSDSSVAHHQEQGRVIDGEFIENCSCGKKRMNAGKGLGEKLPHDPTCTYGTWRVFNQAEQDASANRFYGRNSNSIRKILDTEQEKIMKKGSVEDQDLRTKQTRSLFGMQTKVISVRK